MRCHVRRGGPCGRPPACERRTIVGAHEGRPYGNKGIAMIARRPLRKRTLEPAQFTRRFEAEKALLLQRYCAAFASWRSCALKGCRREQTCRGEAARCLLRATGEVPHTAQWQARQDILNATPANIGAPERAARTLMPRDLLGEAGATAAARLRADTRPRDKSSPARANRFECRDGSVMGSPHVRGDRLGEAAGPRQFNDSRGA